ncbi:hypothetical protein GCM10020229_68360 [Kitasatospora albolonga]
MLAATACETATTARLRLYVRELAQRVSRRYRSQTLCSVCTSTGRREPRVSSRAAAAGTGMCECTRSYRRARSSARSRSGQRRPGPSRCTVTPAASRAGTRASFHGST